MSQFVYVLEDQNTQLIKIGISVDPEFRAKQIDKDFGTATVLVGMLTVDDALKTERFLHAMFAERRIVGEWFELTAHQKAYLLAYFSDKPKTRTPRDRPPKPETTTKGAWTELQQQLRDRVREKRGAQVEIARRLNIKPPSVAGYITGGASIPTEHLDTIQDVLGISFEISEN